MSNPLVAQTILKKGYAINTLQLLAKSPYHFSYFFIEQSPSHKRNEIQLPPLVIIIICLEVVLAIINTEFAVSCFSCHSLIPVLPLFPVVLPRKQVAI